MAKYRVVSDVEKASVLSSREARQNLAALCERVRVYLVNGRSLLDENRAPRHGAPSFSPVLPKAGSEKEHSIHSIIDLLDSPESPDTSGLAVPQSPKSSSLLAASRKTTSVRSPAASALLPKRVASPKSPILSKPKCGITKLENAM